MELSEDELDITKIPLLIKRLSNIPFDDVDYFVLIAVSTIINYYQIDNSDCSLMLHYYCKILEAIRDKDQILYQKFLECHYIFFEILGNYANNLDVRTVNNAIN